MPLSHATNNGVFEKILKGGHLLSQDQSGVARGRAETTLGTTDAVFFYAAAFTYPNSECGFLFLPSVEVDFKMTATATPFDSGAMAHRVTPPAPYAGGVAFVRDHELPVPAYRELLATILRDYTPGADAYLADPAFRCVCGVSRDHPFGLVGLDGRGNTFEVRLPQQVAAGAPHLRAVFVRNGHEPRGLHRFSADGVEIVRYTANDDADTKFTALREASVDFILEHILNP